MISYCMVFEKRKLDTLRKLAEEDKSKKGSVDEKIREILHAINASKDYYTTSSCSGRVLVIDFPVSSKKCDAEWLLSSHDPVYFSQVEEAISRGKHRTWFKMEAAIFHIACKDLGSAEKLLKLVRDVGFKRAGLISLSDNLVIEIIGTEQMACPVAENGAVLVEEKYLRILIKEANAKLSKNQEKLEKLLGSLQSL